MPTAWGCILVGAIPEAHSLDGPILDDGLNREMDRALPDQARMAALEQAITSLQHAIAGIATSGPAHAPAPPADAPVADDAAALRISVVIPLYNGARFIGAALDSVLGQTMPPAEIIVVDDGSTDDGPAIVVRRAETHPITLLRKANGGQSSARNLGIAHSTGTHVALLDQDDIWYPTHLATLASPFLADPQLRLGWSYGNVDEVDEEGRMVARSFLRMLGATHPKRDVFSCLAGDMFVLPSASLIAKDAFMAVGGFDEQLCGYEDDDLFLRLFRSGYDNAFIDEPVSQWRIWPRSSSYSERMLRSRMTYLRKLLVEFPDDKKRRRVYSRDVLATRFLPQVAESYALVVREGRNDAIRMAMAELAFVAGLRYPRMRLLMRAAVPMLGSPPLARALYPLMIGVSPLIRWSLRSRARPGR